MTDFLQEMNREACRSPEVPPSSFAVFRSGCAACTVALKAALSAPAPEGHFNGWYEQRELIRSQMADRGLEL